MGGGTDSAQSAGKIFFEPENKPEVLVSAFVMVRVGTKGVDLAD